MGLKNPEKRIVLEIAQEFRKSRQKRARITFHCILLTNFPTSLRNRDNFIKKKPIFSKSPDQGSPRPPVFGRGRDVCLPSPRCL